MRTAKQIDTEPIYDNFEGRLDLHFSPELSDYKIKHDNSDYFLAQLLTWSKKFNESISQARVKSGIEKIIVYPEKISSDKLIDLIVKAVSYEQYEVMKVEIDEIVETFNLTENWKFSIEVAILTNTLLVPAPERIRLHIPRKIEEEKDEGNKTLSSVLNSSKIAAMQENLRVTQYPAIYFTHQASINEIKAWINYNKPLLRVVLKRLPKKKKINSIQKTIYWGQIAWILIKDGQTSWAKMTKEIEKLIEQSRKENPCDDMGDYDVAPQPEELEKCYKSFLTSLKKLEPTISESRSDD